MDEDCFTFHNTERNVATDREGGDRQVKALINTMRTYSPCSSLETFLQKPSSTLLIVSERRSLALLWFGYVFYSTWYKELIYLKSKIFLQLGAKVVAVEPQASCIAILQIEIGNKATIVAKGVGATSEVKDFYVSTNFELSSFNKEWINTLPVEEYGDTQIKQVEKIEIITLDNLIKQYGKPDFIKIDVEGHELNILNSIDFLKYKITL